MADFALTMPEFREAHRPYQWRYPDEETWRGIPAAQLARWLDTPI